MEICNYHTPALVNPTIAADSYPLSESLSLTTSSCPDVMTHRPVPSKHTQNIGEWCLVMMCVGVRSDRMS